MRSWTRRVWAAAAAATLLTLLVAGLGRLDPVPPGLSGSYFSSRSSSASPTVSTIDSVPSTDRIVAAWKGSPPDAFTLMWRGTIFIPDDGPYTFATKSDDESSVYLDGRMIVENGAQPGLPLASGSVRPDRGLHAIVISYLHNGGTVHFELLWAHDRDELEPVPSWALKRGTSPRPEFCSRDGCRRCWRSWSGSASQQPSSRSR